MSYRILAFRSVATGDGFDYEVTADTLTEARRLARYLISEAFRKTGEMSERFSYAQARNASGKIVFDCIAKKHQPTQP